MLNERAKERTRLIYSLRLFDEKSEESLLGTLVDLTPDGVAIRAKDAVPVGTELPLRMDLPKNVDGGEGSVKFTARSKWCRPNKGGDYFSVGFEFVDIPKDTKALILGLIRNYCSDIDEEEDIDPRSGKAENVI